MKPPFKNYTTCNIADNMTITTYQNLDALLRIFSSRFDTPTHKCNFTIQDGKVAISIWYKDKWYRFLLDEEDYYLLPDTLFQSINKRIINDASQE